jgi:molybdenum cofactor cytidylyltransferase
MRLARALRIAEVPRIAFVGAGGKTTAIFQLARELVRSGSSKKEDQCNLSSVIVCATTHLGVEQGELADYNFIVERPADLINIDLNRHKGIILLSGDDLGDERLAGLDEDTTYAVLDLADRNRLPLLIEADGSCMKPVKAPAEHEPAVPEWVDQVIVVVGLNALGKPLTSEFVHRPHIFASLTGQRLGSKISSEMLEQVLVHPHGGLKNIPVGARCIALLNQADTPDRQAVGGRIAEYLVNLYDAVLISSLNPDPAVTGKRTVGKNYAKKAGVLAVHERIAGIVLAAGESKRFGKPKQLLVWENETFVRRAARTALDAGLQPVLVVTGAYEAKVRRALVDLPVALVHNPEWEHGQASSVRVAIQALEDNIGAAIFLLADQPLVSVPLVQSLKETHSQTLASIIAPMVDGQRGNPVVFDRITFRDLISLLGDTGGRAIFPLYGVKWLLWHDNNIFFDVDTEEDYNALIRKYMK